MSVLDPNGGRAGSLIAAAMETAGMNIQADLLQWISGAGDVAGSGMMLAALLYVIGIVGAVFVIASGGQYIWGRYLLIGPALFFFLTQVTDNTTGSHWAHAAHKFDDAHVQRALRDTGYEPNAEVALFFKFWNNFMSTATQELMGLLNLTQDGSHLDFLTKMERYMNLWLTTKIPDANLQRFIRLVMVNQCADYYMMQMAMADPHVDAVEKENLKAKLADREKASVFSVNRNAPQQGTPMEKWLVENKVLTAGANYNCDQIWKLAVTALAESSQESIETTLSANLSIDQTQAQTTAKFLKKIGTQTNSATGEVLIEQGQALQALNWVIARTLWSEMVDTNKAAIGYDQEGHGGYFASSVPNGAFALTNSGTDTNSAISQFNRVETYQFKGDFVNAALALPYFQGVGLLLLAAAYPFFAMAMVMPGRAGAILLWMGLWAWLKLWDVGFAVVMMIDNILYTIFPRGPAISAGEINQPGRALVALMEQDPGYSSAVYYNIIAICMYAVPLICGVFVKGAGSAVVGLFRDAWQAHATRLAGSAASFAAAAQGQSYVADQRRQEAELTGRAINDLVENDQQFQDDLQDYIAMSTELGLLDGSKENLGKITDISTGNLARRRQQIAKQLGSATGNLADIEKARVKALMDRKKNAMLSAITARGMIAQYNHSAGPGGWWAAESAVAAKYYTHDTKANMPGGAVFAAAMAREYVNQENISAAQVDTIGKTMGDAVQSFMYPAGGVPR